MYSLYSKETLALSSTLIVLFLLQTLSTSAVNYIHIGCYKDKASRAMPKLLGNWRHDNKTVEKCAEATAKAGYLVFGVQNARECWSGPQAHMTYKKYGTSKRCVNGRGGNWAQDVYEIVNASLIANYDVKRCYEVDITFHYKIPGGLKSSTIADTKSDFSDLFNTISSLFKLSVIECSNVIITTNEITASPPGVTSVFFRVPVIFTAESDVPDGQVSSKLTNCINTAKSDHYKGILDSNTPTITEGGTTYNKYNLSAISDKRSCCGGNIPPPCCAAGSMKVSSSKCGCVAGFKYVLSSFCVRCPSDTYQDKQGQTSCENCPGNEKTFGKTAMTSKSNCSDTNPLQIRELKVYLPYNITPGTVVANVTVNGQLSSLVQPFIFYIDSVTQRGEQSRRSLKRRRRRAIIDICEDAGTIVPLNYFCIHRLSGRIEVTRDFEFKDGDEFDLKIRVTDSDKWGKTENTATFKFISRDECKDIRVIYKEAVRFCTKVKVSPANGQTSCPGAECLMPLYKWREAVNASEKLRVDCASDPDNMEAVIQQYSSCIGPPNVTLDPDPQELGENAPAVLTCNASSPLEVTITWYKNGKPIGGEGSQLKIDKLQHEDQGDYYCRFSTFLTSSLSKPALLVLKDVFTSRVSFRIANEKFKDDLLDPSSSSYSDLQIAVVRKLQNYLNSGNPAWKYEVKVVQFRDSSGKVAMDLVIYSSAKTEDFRVYYDRLEKLLADESAMGNTLKPLKVSRKSVTVRSATHCLPKTTGKESIMGVFDWPLTVIGQKSSSVKCPYGPQGAGATRPCGGNFWIGGVWGNPDVDNCKYKSERTNQLNSLAKTPIDKQNVVKVTKDVKNLTSEPDDMNEADAVLIADVIGSVVLLADSLNETAQDVVDVIDNVMKMKKEDLQESQRSDKASTKFLQALDKVATNLPLSDKESSRRVVASSVAIQSNRVDPGSFTGMSLAVKSPTADPNKLTPDSMVSDELPMADVQTSITLPEVMFEKKTPSGKTLKIGFVVYQNDKFFQPVIPDEEESEQESTSVMSRVISSSVQDMAFDNLSKPVELVFEPALELDEESGESVCVFWDFSAMGGLGNWSDRGCKFVTNEAGRVKCHCDHMTNFAVLFSASGPRKHDDKNAMALSIISYVGCAISLVGLTLTLMTYALFRNLRKTNQQPILMSLCVALMLLLIVFIAGAARTENLVGCRIVAVLLHYFALATVMWMGVEGYNMYMSFVQVMATYQSKFMLKASAVAWGVPSVIVIITIASATSYYGNEDVCVLYGVPFQAAQFAPILLIILINFVIFILAIRTLNRTGAMVSAEKKSTSYHRVRTATAILILLGLTWAFGALAVSRAQLVFDYLFCIFNSLQGFLIFYFHCIRHQEVRNQWKSLLLGKGLRARKMESDSRTGYPKTASRQNNYEIGTPLTSLAPGRKVTVTSTVGGGSPTFKPRPDVIPAEV